MVLCIVHIGNSLVADHQTQSQRREIVKGTLTFYPLYELHDLDVY